MAIEIVSFPIKNGDFPKRPWPWNQEVPVSMAVGFPTTDRNGALGGTKRTSWAVFKALVDDYIIYIYDIYIYT